MIRNLLVRVCSCAVFCACIAQVVTFLVGICILSNQSYAGAGFGGEAYGWEGLLDVQPEVVTEGVVAYTDSEGTVRDLIVADCEYGCAVGFPPLPDFKCGSRWQCWGMMVTVISFFSLLITSCLYYKYKKYREGQE